MRRVKNIRAILIDNDEAYRYVLAKHLAEIGVEVMESVAYKNWKPSTRVVRPDCVLLSYEENMSALTKSILFFQTNFTAAKIVVTVGAEDKATVPIDRLKQLGISGLFYKADISVQELLGVIKSVKAGKNYFQNPNKTFP